MSSSLSPQGAIFDGKLRGERDPCVHDNEDRHRLLQSPRPKKKNSIKLYGSGIYFYSETVDGPFELFRTTEALSVSKIRDGVFCLSCYSFQDLP